VRHIDTSNFRRLLPVGWTARAEKALVAVRAAHPSKRAAVFASYSDLWQKDLKLALRDLGYKKCWYCEGNDIRSDGVVDHFRPKGRVWRVPAHPGYWWLAFDPDNYRYCCTLCNSRRLDAARGTSGGKQDRFPLFDENMRAYPERPSKEKDEVVLLDPTVAPDTLLFYFADDGSVRARFPDSARRHLTRVNTSIEWLRLAWSY
jgi:hypothetical protein